MNQIELKAILELHKKYLDKQLDGQWANLHYANLDRADLNGADLREANLSGADLSGADLRGADLTGANLYYANLSGADLREADLRGANLTGADMRGADLHGANLTGANLTWAKGIISIGPIGSRDDILYAVAYTDGPMLKTGCFWGTVAEFESALAKTHGDNQHVRTYRAALAFIQVILDESHIVPA